MSARSSRLIVVLGYGGQRRSFILCTEKTFINSVINFHNESLC